ncbi:MAG: hypothetical protein ACKO1L_02900 [Brachymonas sp.]
MAVLKPAQSAPEIIVSQARSNPSVLPQRNLLIEVRQFGGAISQHSQRGRQLQQEARVFNGGSVSFNLGQSVPMRVVQVLVYKDAVHMVPTSVLIHRNSGFAARPLWYGNDVAEVEISTALVQGARQSKLTTTLPVQMNEWITIAQIEDTQQGGIGGVLSRIHEQALSSLHLEMRVSAQ